MNASVSPISVRLSYLHVLRVEVRGSDGHVHSELTDIEERLLAVERVLVAGQKLAVVIQLNRSERLVL